MSQVTAAAALFCHYRDLDMPPQDAWILKPLDQENWLQKRVRYLKETGLFHRVYILIDSGSDFDAYRSYHSPETPVVQLDSKVYVDSRRNDRHRWNLYHPRTDCDWVLVWIYQIMAELKEDMIYIDPAYNGFTSQKQLQKGLERVLKDPESLPVLLNIFGLGGAFFSSQYMRKHFFKDGALGGKNRILTLETYKDSVLIEEEGETYQDNLMPQRDFRLLRKQNYFLMRRFFRSEESREGEFYHRFKFWLSQENPQSDVEHVEIDAIRQDKKVDFFVLHRVLNAARQIGRLSITFKVNETANGQAFTELMQAIKPYNLHKILKTDGEYPDHLNQMIQETFDVVIYQVDDITPAQLKKRYPQKQSELIFRNLLTMMDLSCKNEMPQVGVECVLGLDAERTHEIMHFWRESKDYVLLFGGPPIQGHRPLRIQFIRYLNPLMESVEKAASDLLNTASLTIDGQLDRPWPALEFQRD